MFNLHIFQMHEMNEFKIRSLNSVLIYSKNKGVDLMMLSSQRIILMFISLLTMKII